MKAWLASKFAIAAIFILIFPYRASASWILLWNVGEEQWLLHPDIQTRGDIKTFRLKKDSPTQANIIVTRYEANCREMSIAPLEEKTYTRDGILFLQTENPSLLEFPPEKSWMGLVLRTACSF